LSYVYQHSFVKCRYGGLAAQCSLSISTVPRAVKGLQAKKLVTTAWESKSGTTFIVLVLSTLPQRPSFLPRRGQDASPRLPQSQRPPVYDAFSPEERALFIACNQRLGHGG
jgi:hypothetical protein